MNVLVIAAHPDDEVLGCGAAMARLAAEGHRVWAAILGEGIKSRRKIAEHESANMVNALREQAGSAAAMLGVQSLLRGDFPDNRFDTVPLLTIAQAVEDIMALTNPDIVFTHHGGDLNIDHSLVNRATLIAARPMVGSTVRKIYAYEVPSSTEWSFQSVGHPFSPNFFINVSDYLDVKIRALRFYKSEIRDCPHPRSEEIIRAMALRWGSVAGCGAAEAFQLIREVY
ncbi:MAG: PIG-L deacetylase family protein [Pseudomonadota bacterium]